MVGMNGTSMSAIALLFLLDQVSPSRWATKHPISVLHHSMWVHQTPPASSILLPNQSHSKFSLRTSPLVYLLCVPKTSTCKTSYSPKYITIEYHLCIIPTSHHDAATPVPASQNPKFLSALVLPFQSSNLANASKANRQS